MPLLCLCPQPLHRITLTQVSLCLPEHRVMRSIWGAKPGAPEPNLRHLGTGTACWPAGGPASPPQRSRDCAELCDLTASQATMWAGCLPPKARGTACRLTGQVLLPRFSGIQGHRQGGRLNNSESGVSLGRVWSL